MFSGVAWTITKWTDEALEAIGLTLDGLLEPEEPNAQCSVMGWCVHAHRMGAGGEGWLRDGVGCAARAARRRAGGVSPAGIV